MSPSDQTDSRRVRAMLTWDARIVGFAELPRDWLTGGTVDVVFKPELSHAGESHQNRSAWADLLASYVRANGQPWNEMTRFAVRFEEVGDVG